MRIFKEIFFNFIPKEKFGCNDKRSKYIFYKIVHYDKKNEEYTLQCINTNAVFRLKITDIVCDITILMGLHPIQSCYVGLEYAHYIKKDKNQEFLHKSRKIEYHTYCRYGLYLLQYQDRKRNIYFVNRKTNQSFLMDPRDLALSEDLIQEFDASQSFYIGFYAGLKTNNPVKKKHSPPILKIVK